MTPEQTGTCKENGPNCQARPASPGYTSARCYRCNEHCCAACAMVTNIPDVGERRLCSDCNKEVTGHVVPDKQKTMFEVASDALKVTPVQPERIRCAPPNLCIRLSERANEPNARKKGFTEVVFTHFETGRVRWVGVAYKQDAKDRGLMLNFCPFCGVQLVTEGWTGIIVRDNWNG